MLGKSVRNILSEIIQCIVSNIFSPFIRKNPLTVFINGHFVYLENICSIYNQNKKILLNKSDVFFEFLDTYISNMEFDLSFLEKMDIELLIKKFEQLCANSYINFMTNDIRKKVIESFKKFINGMIYIHASFSSIMLNYTSFSSNIRIVRAPPVYCSFI
jgi:hypothetical protein